MQVVSRYPDGVFSWADLASSDADAAKAFYTGLFGWEAEDLFMPTDDGPVYIYTMFTLQGKNVAGLGPLPAEMQAQGVPSHWAAYVNHSDADAVAAKITASGGTVFVPPMDVMDSGRMLMANDPSGATFGVWQPRNHTGAQLINMPGTMVWTELQSRQAAAMQPFYAAVFGWESRQEADGYNYYQQGEHQAAGAITIDDSWPETVPNHWAVYFMVAEIDAALQQAQALGGTVMMPATPAGEMGHFAVIADPTGAVFTVMTFNDPLPPPAFAE